MIHSQRARLPQDVRYPTPLLPKFPTAYSSTIEDASQRVEEFLSSLIEPLPELNRPSFGSETTLDQIRSYFGVVDAKIRTAFMSLEIMNRVQARARRAFYDLKQARDDQWAEFQKRDTECLPSRWAKFPMEVIHSICALDCLERHPSVSVERWGDMFFQTDAVAINSAQMAKRKSCIAKSSHLILDVETHAASVPPFTIEAGRWRELRILRPPWPRQWVSPPVLFDALEIARSILPILQGFRVICGAFDLPNYRKVYPSLPNSDDGVHRCPACVPPATSNRSDLTLLKCKVAKVPLPILPYIGPSLPHLVHLSVQLPPLLVTHSEITSHFYHVSLQQLQTLQIMGFNIGYFNFQSAPDHLEPGPILHIPSLKSLIVAVGPSALYDAVLPTLLEHLHFPNLEHFILWHDFQDPKEESSSSESDPDSDSEKSEDCQPLDYQEIFKILADKCQGLKRLSIYPNHGDSDFVPETSPARTNVHNILEFLCKTLLSKAEDGSVNFPDLTYLSVPSDGYMPCLDSLIDAIRTRMKMGNKTGLSTLELSCPPFDGVPELCYAKFHVDNIIVPKRNLFRLYFNSYFPPPMIT